MRHTQNLGKQVAKKNYAKPDPDKVEKIELPEDIKEKLRKHLCVKCGITYSDQTNYFPPSQSPWFVGNNYRLPVCNKCLNGEFINLSKRLKSPEEAYKRLCMQWDVYFHKDLVKIAETNGKIDNKFSYYCKRACMKKYEGKTYDSTIKEEIVQQMKQMEKEEFKDTEDIKRKAKIKDTAANFWGYCFSAQEYEYLNMRYSEWITSYECKNKAQETIFKNICLIDLQIQRALADGKNTDSLYKQMNEWMSSANIQPKQNNDNALSDSQTFGTLIRKWEDEDPIPEPKSEWKDVDGIKKYISVWLFGHLCKMLGLKNEWSKMYESEINKYTVQPNTIEDEQDSASFDDVFGSISQ